MNTATQTDSNLPVPTTAQIAEMHTGQVFYDSKNPVSVAGLVAGDKLQIWIDGARKPVKYEVDCIGALGALVGIKGARKGEAYLVVNVGSQRVSLIVGARSKGIVSRILRNVA